MKNLSVIFVFLFLTLCFTTSSLKAEEIHLKCLFFTKSEHEFPEWVDSPLYLVLDKTDKNVQIKDAPLAEWLFRAPLLNDEEKYFFLGGELKVGRMTAERIYYLSRYDLSIELRTYLSWVSPKGGLNNLRPNKPETLETVQSVFKGQCKIIEPPKPKF